ncbi:MAG: hypothetical protein WAT70_13900 [Rhizobiaceae bacterium]
MTNADTPRWVKPAAIAALAFGGLTILSGGTALFGGAGAQALAGNAVPFVLWFNFLAGFAYVATAVGLLAGRSWAPNAALVIALASLAVFAAFAFAAATGTPFEPRTFGAMTLRAGFWLAIAIAARRTLFKTRHIEGTMT